MRFPEWLYKLLPGDAGTQQLGVVWREISSTANNVTVGATVYTVPNDKCLVLTNATIEAEPPATIAARRLRVIADPPEGTTRYNIYDSWGTPTAASGTAVFRAETWRGEVVIPGGWKVRGEVTHNGADAGNNMNCEIHGYLIPRGTFVFG